MLSSLAACAPRAISAPANEATPEEQKKLEATIDEIETRMGAQGNSANFRALPIMVITENVEANNRVAYCMRDALNNGQYIAINRRVFEDEAREPIFHEVFATLLHEIGHCYFGREHEHVTVGKPGYSIEITAWDSTHGVSSYTPGFPVSMMYVHDEKDGGTPAVSLEIFKDYFVQEILGKNRMQSIDDLMKYPGIRLINSDGPNLSRRPAAI